MSTSLIRPVAVNVNTGAVTYDGAVTGTNITDGSIVLADLSTQVNAMLRAVSGTVKARDWYYSSGDAVSTSNTQGNGTVKAMPVILPAGTLVDLGVEFNAAGVAGSTVRIGLAADDGAGRPGTVLAEGSVIATSANSVQVLSAQTPAVNISVAITGGLYWKLAAVQGAATTQPTVYAVSNPNRNVPVPALNLSTLPTFGSGARVGIVHDTTITSGAFPATFTANATTGTFPRFLLKFSA